MWLEQPPAFPPKTEPRRSRRNGISTRRAACPTISSTTAIAGWDGQARIDWTDRGVAVDIEADSATRYYHVYSLGKDCPIFCFEPVTHPNNAYGKPGGAEANGLRVLSKGESTSMRVRLTAKSR